MELLFDHTFGKQEQQDLVICRPMALVDEDEEAEAIDRGWLALDHRIDNYVEVFYQSRSTRIDVDKYKPRYKSRTWKGEEIKLKIIDASEMVKLLGLPDIYKRYMQRKNFGADYDPFANYHRRDQFMIFYTGTADNILGFTKQKRYRYQEDNYPAIDAFDSQDLAGLESVIHANTVPISDITLDLEIEWAANNYVRYFYMGSGYENSSEYKANYNGFQWWTGTEWSTNKKQYRRLCRRDSKLTEFSSLGNLSLIEDNS
jgi:hypothetical protein|tara:strand:+ start:64 stop:837 length:774 start_codon:yes stop_codon:yes gene_type:complete